MVEPLAGLLGAATVVVRAFILSPLPLTRARLHVPFLPFFILFCFCCCCCLPLLHLLFPLPFSCVLHQCHCSILYCSLFPLFLPNSLLPSFPMSSPLPLISMQLAQPLLPYALAFAAGAMVFVVVDDIIPESFSRYQD